MAATRVSGLSLCRAVSYSRFLSRGRNACLADAHCRCTAVSATCAWPFARLRSGASLNPRARVSAPSCAVGASAAPASLCEAPAVSFAPCSVSSSSASVCRLSHAFSTSAPGASAPAKAELDEGKKRPRGEAPVAAGREDARESEPQASSAAEGAQGKATEESQPQDAEPGREPGYLSAVLMATLLFGGLVVEAARVFERANRENKSVTETIAEELKDLDARMSHWNEQLHLYLDKKIGTGKKEAEPLLPDLAEINAPDLMPTLVLNFDNVLAYIAYDPVKGYIVRKRPGVDAFLSTLANFYELVLWSEHPFPFIEDLLRTKLEWPVSFTLYQENMDCRGSVRYRNLERLGRRMDRVLYIDVDGTNLPASQTANFIKVAPFHGEAQEMLEDRALPELTDLLIGAAISAGDVREVLLRYGGGADGNVGKRFLVEKLDAEKRANQRRNIGRAFGFSGGSGTQARQKWEK
ncbi:NLI interacting factor family phosphatase [Besnoitia besnoiti]|uniref:Mitochondrial import inner membrane translocase subunit TIM50 n=1 Tax=Besnoitia besnoiti TaxID=94643 RepID=A0A2A9M620_BESBE|nr:NLI interacting factor family phosphatase [Besnoitia besnoiti]PFH33389.1 NLI interacting factor family phosphatase [Besnoitia besnoiti]